METRLVRVEETAERLEEGLERVQANFMNFREKMAVKVDEEVECLSLRAEALEAGHEALEATVEALRASVVQLEEKLATCEGAIGRVPAAVLKPPKVEVPKPKEFTGVREAKEVDNFLWSVEQYFRAKSIEDEAIRVNTAAMYLTDYALLWWRGRYEGAKRGGVAIETWETFQQEFRKQFYPVYATEEARRKLRRLAQTGGIREYVREFTELVLQIPDYSREEALFSFVDGLKPWAKQELQRREVKDLDKAITAAECLVEFSGEDEPDSPRSDGTSQRQEKGEGDGQEPVGRKAANMWRSPRGRDRRWAKPGEQNGGKTWDKQPMSCYLCEGPHRALDCPNRKKMTAIMQELGKPDGEQQRLGAMVLNAEPATEEGQ